MKTITLKVPEILDHALTRAAAERRVSKSQLIRESIEQHVPLGVGSARKRKKPSLHDRMKKYIPKAGSGIRDLGSSPKHLEGFGEG